MDVKRGVRLGEKVGRAVTMTVWVGDDVADKAVRSVIQRECSGLASVVADVVLADREEG